MRKRINGWILAVLCGQLLGCSDEDLATPSNWLATSEIYAGMRATQYSDGAIQTTVELRDGPLASSRYIYLSDEDHLLSSLDGAPSGLMSFDGDLFSSAYQFSNQVSELEERNLYYDYLLFTSVAYGKPEYYSITYEPLRQPVTVYVSLVRPESSQHADSSVTLPSPFTLLAPAAMSEISRSTDLTISWSDLEPAANMVLDVAAICDGVQGTRSINLGADTGSAVLGSTEYFPNIAASGNCSVMLMLKRARYGTVSPALLGGYFEGIQQRSVQFISTP